MRALLRRHAFAVLVLSTACSAPLVLAEPRDEGSDFEAGAPSLGDRPDVEETDVFVVIQTEGGLVPDDASMLPDDADAGDAVPDAE